MSDVNLTLERAVKVLATEPGLDTEDVGFLRELLERITSVSSFHDVFRTWCDRYDALYFTTDFTQWGADLWAGDPSATTPGRSHVSVNTPAAYVDIPAALQSVPPIENMLSTEDSEEARIAAQQKERLYKAWQRDEKFHLKFSQAAVIKGLYGLTAGFIYWDREQKRPAFDVIRNPRNLYLGWQSDDFDVVEWAAHVSLIDKKQAMALYSVDVVAMEADGKRSPWITLGSTQHDRAYPVLTYEGDSKIEVWDYWFRLPGKRGRVGEPTKMETWNAVIVGNEIVRKFKYSEYRGTIPYIPLRNTFIPNLPAGRPDLHDVEQLIREKMTRITSGAAMIRRATAGDYWQLVGPDAPNRVPPAAVPKENEVAAPGAGNRIEAITPFIAQFQLEQYLGRIDKEATVITGLNDLLLGLAPAQVLSSSKAINALVANYESRISMRRMLFFDWRWTVAEMWWTILVEKDATAKTIQRNGGGVLEIIDPSLSPRDEMETATRAANLVGAKLWSQARGMDAVGVDDPEAEQNLIRAERTDATMFPADVQVMAQLLAALQSLGVTPPAGAQQMAGDQAASASNDLRTALGAGTPDNVAGQPAGGDTGITPPDALVPGATPTAEAPFAQGPTPPVMQGMLQNGQAKGRIMTQTQLGRRP